MKSCTCATPGSPVEAPRPSLHDCDEPNKDLLAPTRLTRKPSKQKVSLYEFADYFRRRGCRNALYLDGFVSRTYAPAQHWVQTDGDFGVMIAVTEAAGFQ